VIIFLVAWGIANVLLLARTIKPQGMEVPPLFLTEQAKSYNCTSDQVRKWREVKILTVTIDNSGNIDDAG